MCLRAVDNLGNTSYLVSANPLNIDVTNPVITVNNDVSMTFTNSDTINVTATDTNISTRNYGFSADNICDGTDTYPNSFTSGSNFNITSETNNGKYMCFRAVDTAGNTSYLVSANPLNIDITNPAISITDDVVAGPVTSDTVAANITDTNITLREYALSADATCNVADFPGTTYTNSSTLTFNTQTNNGKWVCFKGADGAGNITYAASANPLNIDVTSPAISITDNVAAGPVQSDTVIATVTDTNITLREYALSADATCNVADFPGTAYTSGSSLVFNTQTNNGKWVCFKGADGAGNITYSASANPLNIDVTNPIITFNDNVAVGPISSDTINVTATDTNLNT